MAEEKTYETMQKMGQVWYESGQAFMQSTMDIQERSLKYAQNSFIDGLETFKSNIEATSPWLRMSQTAKEQQQAIPSLMESGIEAYKRNVAYLQRITEQGIETYKANAGTVRDMTQKMMHND